MRYVDCLHIMVKKVGLHLHNPPPKPIKAIHSQPPDPNTKHQHTPVGVVGTVAVMVLEEVAEVEVEVEVVVVVAVRVVGVVAVEALVVVKGVVVVVAVWVVDAVEVVVLAVFGGGSSGVDPTGVVRPPVHVSRGGCRTWGHAIAFSLHV